MVMSNRNTLRLLVSASLCAWPVLAAAQQQDGQPVLYTSEVEIGGGWVTDDSFKFGEYSGLEDDGPFAIGTIDVLRRSPYDGDSTRYWEVYGTNLGLDSRSVHAEYGHQGDFSLFLDYDQLPHNRLEDAQTPYIGAGGENLTLPAGWVSATNVGGLTALNASLRDVEIETERMEYGGGASWNITNNWQIKAAFHREEKDGLETVAGIFGDAGGGPAGPLGAILPQPVDQTTDEGSIGVSYTGKKFQAQLGYNVSLFNNDVDSLTWLNPFDRLNAWDVTQDFDFGGQGRLALEPDNAAHQVTGSAGYTFDSTTRVVGSFSYGRMTQDDDFLPFTVNPNLVVPVGLPRSDLDGEVNTMHGNLTVASRPLQKLDVRGRYTFDDRDNDTPRDVYLTVPGDIQDQGPLTGSQARINRPYSRRSHKIELDGGYRVLSSLKVGLGYDFETIDRDFTEVKDVDEHTGRIKLSFSPSHLASGWVSYARSFRSGSEYVDNRQLLVSHSPEFLATQAPEDLFENDPELRKYYIADRERDEVKASVTFVPSEQFTAGLAGTYRRDDYDETRIGLTERNYLSATVDVVITPVEQLAFTFFTTVQRNSQDQDGFSRPGNVPFPPSAAVARDLRSKWDVVTIDRTYTAGTEIEWEVLKNELEIGLDALLSYSFSDFDIDGGTNLNFESLPETRTALYSIGVRADYKVMERVSIRPAYRFERYKTKDFAQDGVHPDTIGQIISLGDRSPDYDVHVVGVSAAVRF
jgi:MtrB/PioB family decaheme-associated outer membrane protein